MHDSCSTHFRLRNPLQSNDRFLIATPPPPFPPTQVMISSCTQDKINVEIYEELKINSTDVFAIYALSNVKYENEI